MKTFRWDAPLPGGIDISAELELFQRYADRFLGGSQADVSHILLKRDHSLRVLDNARIIVGSLGLDPDMARLCLLGALFHDVGRFLQYQRHKTFHDGNSENHGLLGCRVIRQEGLLDGADRRERGLVRCIVAVHNRRFLPPGLGADLRLAADVVRDADKLDIMRVMLEHFTPQGETDPVVTLSVKDHPDNYSSVIYDQVMNREQANYKDMVWVNDFKLLLCSWACSLCFPASRGLLRERGYMDELFGLLPDTPAIDLLRQRVREALDGPGDVAFRPQTSASARGAGGTSRGEAGRS
jgi:hypothetical protein